MLATIPLIQFTQQFSILPVSLLRPPPPPLNYPYPLKPAPPPPSQPPSSLSFLPITIQPSRRWPYPLPTPTSQSPVHKPDLFHFDVSPKCAVLTPSPYCPHIGPEPNPDLFILIHSILCYFFPSLSPLVATNIQSFKSSRAFCLLAIFLFRNIYSMNSSVRSCDGGRVMARSSPES